VIAIRGNYGEITGFLRLLGGDDATAADVAEGLVARTPSASREAMSKVADLSTRYDFDAALIDIDAVLECPGDE
jgi:hypothetical protein